MPTFDEEGKLVDGGFCWEHAASRPRCEETRVFDELYDWLKTHSRNDICALIVRDKRYLFVHLQDGKKTWTIPDAKITTLNDRFLLIEVDENSHVSNLFAYTACSELKKLILSSAALLGDDGARLPVFTIRFNPNAFDGASRVPRTERIETLGRCLEYLIDTPLEEIGDVDLTGRIQAHVVYLYYHSKAQEYIDAAVVHPDIVVLENFPCFDTKGVAVRKGSSSLIRA